VIVPFCIFGFIGGDIQFQAVFKMIIRLSMRVRIPILITTDRISIVPNTISDESIAIIDIRTLVA